MSRRPDDRAIREPQLAYSELQRETRDEDKRASKARKIRAVLQHFLGREDLRGLRIVDIGCSTGFVAHELSVAGGSVLGLDIDVPGLEHARRRFGDHVHFARADGSAMPLGPGSVDIVIFNHIYEHVVAPEAVIAEIRRVLAPTGIAYLAFGNRFGVIEPHYKLPFLSWLPPRLADRYVALSGRSDHYYEQLRSRSSLLRMCRGLTVWDYTYAVLSHSRTFAAEDMVPRQVANMPHRVWRLATPVIPTFIWIGARGENGPLGSDLRSGPVMLRAATSD